jgi:hypothetical protein
MALENTKRLDMGHFVISYRMCYKTKKTREESSLLRATALRKDKEKCSLIGTS